MSSEIVNWTYGKKALMKTVYLKMKKYHAFSGTENKNVEDYNWNGTVWSNKWSDGAADHEICNRVLNMYFFPLETLNLGAILWYGSADNTGKSKQEVC